MGKSKLKLALARRLGKDPVKEKRLKLAHKKGKEKLKKKSGTDEEWEDGDSDEVPELVDTSIIDDEAEEASEGEIEAEESKRAKKKPSKKAQGEQDSDKEEGDDYKEVDEEEVDEDEDEDEDEDVALSDIESDNDLETPDVIPHQKLTIDNHAALTSLRNRIAIPINKMTFGEHRSLTTSEPVEIPDIDDDLNRELAFYKQALDAAKKGRELLKKEKVPFERPSDYFAEMMKDDEHMGKVKGKLLDEAERKKRSQEARKLRDLKKFGKQVQVAKLQEREKEKKQTLEKIQLLKRKRAGADTGDTNEDDMFDIALDKETADIPRRKKGDRSSDDKSRAKRVKKDHKYGFGGKKKHAKSNDAKSSGDLGDFSSKRNKASFGGSSKKKTAQRPGKSKRAAMRQW